MNEADLGVDAIDAQVRPDRLADVMDSRLEDLVRPHHALGPDAAEVTRALSRPHRHQVRLGQRDVIVDGRRLGRRAGGRIEEGTEELEPDAERSGERPRQVGPVGQPVRHDELVDVAEHDVPTGRHLAVQTVLDRHRLAVVPDVAGHAVGKSPVDDVDATRPRLVATSAGVMLNQGVSLGRSIPLVDDDAVGTEDERQLYHAHQTSRISK